MKSTSVLPLPQLWDDSRKPLSWKPKKYMLEAVKFLLEHACAALFLDPGLGKTAITLAAIKILKQKKLTKKVLLIAPLRVCELVWPKEQQKWSDFHGLTIIFLHGKNKDQLLHEKADIYLINPEGLEWLLQVQKTKTPRGKIRVHIDLARWNKFGFDLLAIDELSKFKHISSARFKMMKLILGTFRRRWGLTGSPAANGLLDLFGQCYMLDQGRSLGSYITHYRMKYFEPVDKEAYVWKIRPGAEKEIYEQVSPLALRMADKDYLQMPELIVNTIKVDLPPKVRVMYDRLHEDLITKIMDEVVTASTVAVASMKCLAEGAEVLTINGWKPIELCTSQDRVWDGLEWVSIGGSVYNGYKNVVECYGIRMTSDHKVLTVSGWKTAREILDEPTNRYAREEVRLPNSGKASRQQKDIGQICGSSLVDKMRLWKHRDSRWSFSSQQEQGFNKVMWLPPSRNFSPYSWHTWHVIYNGIRQMAWYGSTMYEPEDQRMGVLRRQRNQGVREVVDVQRILEGHGARFFPRTDVRTQECQRQLSQEKLSLGHHQRTKQQYAKFGIYQDSTWSNDSGSSSGKVRNQVHHASRTNFSLEMEDQESVLTTSARVYDLINAGPRNRFVVRGLDGKLLIVHNCRQLANGGIYLDPEIQQQLNIKSAREWVNVHTEKVDALADLIDELQGSPLLIAYDFEHDLDRLRIKFGKDIPYIGGGVSSARAKDLESLWNQGKLPFLFGHPQAMAHGLNLQERAHHVAWHSQTWDYELYDQFIRRVRRQGNAAERVFVHHIIARDTVDDAMMASIRSKQRGQQGFFDGLKAMQKIYRRHKK